jgi:hypothetical protein
VEEGPLADELIGIATGVSRRHPCAQAFHQQGMGGAVTEMGIVTPHQSVIDDRQPLQGLACSRLQQLGHIRVEKPQEVERVGRATSITWCGVASGAATVDGREGVFTVPGQVTHAQQAHGG